MMLRLIALFAISLILLPGCRTHKDYPVNLNNLGKNNLASTPTLYKKSAKQNKSNSVFKEKPIIETLSKEGKYIIVSGKKLGEFCEELNGEQLRIDAFIDRLSPGVEAGMSRFETRDGNFIFEVSWKDVNSEKDMEEILKIKETILNNFYESKFRLYGRWKYEVSLFKIYSELSIDKWEIVEWQEE
jgi:hypothetical protein